MYLHRDDIEKILEVLKKFPDVETIEVKQDNSSGIGCDTSIIIPTNINEVSGSFEISISSVENW